MEGDAQALTVESANLAQQRAKDHLAEAQKAADKAQAKADQAKADAARAAADAAEAQAKANEAAEAAVDPETRNPMKFMVLDDARGSYEECPVPEGWFWERRMHFRGVNWEHTAEDAYGRWMYRQM